MNDELLKIGILTRLHGHRGELQCRAENSLWEDADDPTWLFLRLDGLDVPFRVLDWRTKGTDELLFTLKGVDSEEKALRLVGAEAFMLLREANVPAEGNLMTWQDLAGWTVRSPYGEEAQIADVDTTTANCLARLHDGRLIPLHEDLIAQINPDDKILTYRLALTL